MVPVSILKPLSSRNFPDSPPPRSSFPLKPRREPDCTPLVSFSETQSRADDSDDASSALALAAFLVTAIPRWASSGNPTTAPIAGQPVLSAQEFTFAPDKIHVKAGETVALSLDNRDGYPHQFDLDALNIHVPMPAGQTILARFTSTQPGTYMFYCVLHTNKATGQGMVGTLIVAP